MANEGNPLLFCYDFSYSEIYNVCTFYTGYIYEFLDGRTKKKKKKETEKKRKCPSVYTSRSSLILPTLPTLPTITLVFSSIEESWPYSLLVHWSSSYIPHYFYFLHTFNPILHLPSSPLPLVAFLPIPWIRHDHQHANDFQIHHGRRETSDWPDVVMK